MADHININHPQFRARERSDRIKAAELEAKIGVLEMYLRAVEADLEAIFNRVERGLECELHMPDRTVYVVTGYRDGEEPANG